MSIPGVNPIDGPWLTLGYQPVRLYRKIRALRSTR